MKGTLTFPVHVVASINEDEDDIDVEVWEDDKWAEAADYTNKWMKGRKSVMVSEDIRLVDVITCPIWTIFSLEDQRCEGLYRTKEEAKSALDFEIGKHNLEELAKYIVFEIDLNW